MSLNNKVAIVTGGGQGLGEAICFTLAREGVSVIVADINEKKALGVAEELKKNNLVAEGKKLDVSSEEEVVNLIKETTKVFGELDIVVNNAGTDVTKPLNELEVNEWDKILGVNLRGPFLLSKYSFPVMASQKNGGQIVNITSTAAKRSWANAAAYHASKWGLLGFSHALHVEGRKERIKVTAIISGGMRTPFILERFPETDSSVLQDPKNVAEVVKFVLMQPEETVIPEILVIPVKETSWP